MGRSLSKAAKERWRKRKAAMEASQNEADGPNHSALTTDNEPSKHSQSAAFSSKSKTSKANNMVVIRSGRVKSLGSFGKRQGRQYVHHIDLTNCERDGELHVEPISLEPINDVSSSEMKVDYLVHIADGSNHSALTANKERSSQSAAFSSKRKTSKANDMIIRQSGQLKSLGSFGKRQGREGAQHVDPTNCARDTELHVEPISPKSIRDMSSSEMIVDHLVQTRGKSPFASETTLTNLNYKILYTDSYKKIEALTEENYRQAQKLYYMLGKVKIYENMIGIVMNLSGGAIKLHPDAATLNCAPAPKSSPVKKKRNIVKRMKKH